MTHPLRLQHHDLVTSLCKLERGRKSGVAGADHADVGVDVALQAGKAGEGGGGGLIIGPGVG